MEGKLYILSLSVLIPVSYHTLTCPWPEFGAATFCNTRQAGASLGADILSNSVGGLKLQLTFPFPPPAAAAFSLRGMQVELEPLGWPPLRGCQACRERQGGREGEREREEREIEREA